uniref:Solute carrier family 25 member 11 n=1 Tax=Apteryx owenii TaxID=8824 RepID=A0A8B9PFR8_APTOW
MGATVFVQPLDLVKNRMQLSGEGAKTREYKTSLHAVGSIVRREGLRGIYTGLSAGLLRQATYTTTRLGIYTVLFERLTGADGTPPAFLTKALIGMTAGATGAFVGTPAEVALIRMTADGRLPPGERRGYRNVFDALLRITREEGVPTLWRGCLPTMARAVVVNAAQLASYSQSKQFLLDSGESRFQRRRGSGGVVSGSVASSSVAALAASRLWWHYVRRSRSSGGVVSSSVAAPAVSQLWWHRGSGGVMSGGVVAPAALRPAASCPAASRLWQRR